MNITAVVTTYNDANSVVPFLNGIREQTVYPDEMIIVDGGSTDNTVACIEEYSKTNPYQIALIADGKRRNISEGINEGIKRSKTDWVLILGTGNYYNKQFISQLIDKSKNCAAEVIYSSIIGMETTKFAHLFNQYFLQGNRKQDLDASNHGVLIRKTVFEKVGYFWEHFIYAGEDFEYFARVRRAGIECAFVPEAIAYWDTPQTFTQYLKKMQVNSIADWQIEAPGKIVRNCMIQIIMLTGYGTASLIQPLCLLLFLPIIALFAVKKKTSNLLAVLLGIFNRYVMIYFYIRNRKYCDKAYHLPKKLY
jgi:GT2 family glycosyltransferase